MRLKVRQGGQNSVIESPDIDDKNRYAKNPY